MNKDVPTIKVAFIGIVIVAIFLSIGWLGCFGKVTIQSKPTQAEKQVEQYDYKGHKYLIFEIEMKSGKYFIQMLHDPDCPCLHK